MARPKKAIDDALVKKLAAIHCTMNEIAAVCECSVDTLERRFADTIKNEREKGKTSLRRYQWEAAQKGNIGMMIWLGKQYLGQADAKDIRLDNNLTVKSADKEADSAALEEFKNMLKESNDK